MLAEVSETRYSQKGVENKCNTKAKLQRHSCHLKTPKYCFLLGLIAQSVDRKLVHWTGVFSQQEKAMGKLEKEKRKEGLVNGHTTSCSSAEMLAELHVIKT